MNLFQLIAKQMRQRALSSWLTLASVTLGVALGVALLVFQREGGRFFGQTEFGYDVVVGAKGSRLQLILNAVYQLDEPPGTIPWAIYEAMYDRQQFAPGVQWAVPVATADTLAGFPVLATLPSILGVEMDGQTPLPEGRVFEYRIGRRLQLAEGRPFHGRKFEAVLGSRVARETGLKAGEQFRVTHGTPGEPGAHDHSEQWLVTGILEPTGTAIDGNVLLPLVSSLAIDAHGRTLDSIHRLIEAGTNPASLHVDVSHVVAAGGREFDYYALEPETGIIHLKIPPELWRISGIYVNSRSGFRGQRMLWEINNLPDAMAANPAREMRQFFERFLSPLSMMLLGVTVLVTVVAAVSILVSIYNSVAARRREIAILRSLGATRATVLGLICLEAAALGAAGGVLGLILGHALAAGLSQALWVRFGEGIDWLSVGGNELAFLGGVVVLSVLAGLVPALKAYATPVAQNLAE